MGTVVELTRTCEFYAEPDCAGAGMALQGFRSRLTSAGRWLFFAGNMESSALGKSAICEVTMGERDDMPFEAFLDSLSFELQDPIFSDGFESGDTSRWSATVN